MFVAFILMWACTPSSLRRDNNREVSEVVGNLPLPDAVPIDTLAAIAPAIADAISETVEPDVAAKVQEMIETADLDTLKQIAETVELPATDNPTELVDTLQKMIREDDKKTIAKKTKEIAAKADSMGLQMPTVDAELDSLIKTNIGSAASKMKRDTTQMDSLQLAIFKYNKVIDDSLTLDSLNRQKKNGIDAPVKYTANDSLTYEAASGRAHLYGDSHVEYMNMDLKSEKIYMVLDSSLVHATGIRDTTTNKLKGTPVFKMGSDEYLSDTMAFNFKTKKGLITQVYTQQEDGYLTSEISKRGGNGELFL